MDSVWLDGLEATPEAPGGGGAACVSRGATGGAGRVGASPQRTSGSAGPGAPEHWARLSTAYLPWVASAGLQRPLLISVWHRLVSIWEQTKTWTLRGRGKEWSWFKMLSVLNINGNMFLKHSIFRGVLSPGPFPSLYQMNGFCLFALYAILWSTLFIRWHEWWYSWFKNTFLMLVCVHRLSQVGQVGWFPNPKYFFKYI